MGKRKVTPTLLGCILGVPPSGTPPRGIAFASPHACPRITTNPSLATRSRALCNPNPDAGHYRVAENTHKIDKHKKILALSPPSHKHKILALSPPSHKPPDGFLQQPRCNPRFELHLQAAEFTPQSKEIRIFIFFYCVVFVRHLKR